MLTLSPADIDAIADAVVAKLSQHALQGDDGPLTAVMLAADDPIEAIRKRNRAIKAKKVHGCGVESRHAPPSRQER